MSNFTHLVILGTMRTGSNLLERILIQHPEIVLAGELFNQNFIGSIHTETLSGFDISTRDADPAGFLRRIAEDDRPFLPLFRYFNDHTPAAFDIIMNDPKIGKIILRRNTLDSFISREAARRTDSWILGRRADPITPKNFEVDIALFQQWDAEVGNFYHRAEQVLAESGQSPYRLAYPDIKNINVINEIISHFGVTPKLRYFFEPLKKQLAHPPLSYVKNKDQIARLRPDDAIPRSDNPDHVAAIDTVCVARNIGLAYYPLYASNERADLTNLAKANGGALENLTVAEFRALDNPPALFTRVIDPQLRAAEIYTRLLFEANDHLGTAPGSFTASGDQWPVPLDFVNRPAILKRRYDLDPVKFRRSYKQFIINLRKELWGGKRRYVRTDLYWPQTMLIANADFGDQLEILVGENYPQTARFAALAAMTTARDYLDRPFPDSVLRDKFGPQLVDLYREDYERFFADKGERQIGVQPI